MTLYVLPVALTDAAQLKDGRSDATFVDAGRQAAWVAWLGPDERARGAMAVDPVAQRLGRADVARGVNGASADGVYAVLEQGDRSACSAHALRCSAVDLIFDESTIADRLLVRSGCHPREPSLIGRLGKQFNRAGEPFLAAWLLARRRRERKRRRAAIDSNFAATNFAGRHASAADRSRSDGGRTFRQRAEADSCRLAANARR